MRRISVVTVKAKRGEIKNIKRYKPGSCGEINYARHNEYRD